MDRVAGRGLIYFGAIVSALVTAGIFVVMARLSGIADTGILIAIAVMAGGIHVIVLLIWFLYHGKAEGRAGDPLTPNVGVDDVTL